MYHKVFVEVKIPDGELCYWNNNTCQFYTDGEFGPCCNLFNKTIKQFKYGFPLKLYQCKRLDVDRVCINCGHYNSSYCEINDTNVLKHDSCNKFQYGSWK
jgi:hypothetical protein